MATKSKSKRAPRPLTACCDEVFQTEDGWFQPTLQTQAAIDEARAAGKPVFCAGCGESVTA